MNLKFVLVGLAAAGLAATSALAAPPADKGKPATGPGCRPQIMVVLKGTLASTPGASATTVSVNVKSGNRWGRAYVKGSQPLSVGVNAATKIRRQGAKTLASLQKDDRVLVQARACKADLSGDATPPALTARMVVAHPASAANDENKSKDKNNGKNGDDGKEDDDD